jgi:hypothetical protein
LLSSSVGDVVSVLTDMQRTTGALFLAYLSNAADVGTYESDSVSAHPQEDGPCTRAVLGYG